MTEVKKYVITGGPCSGKTAVIDSIKQKGYPVVSETAREILLSFRGLNLDIRENLERAQLKIFREQIRKEYELGRLSNQLFLDRSVLDVIVYSNLFLGYIPEEMRVPNFSNEFELIFVLDLLPLIQDEVRHETEEKQRCIHEALIKAYTSQGYSPMIVPVMSIDDRVELILNTIQNRFKGGK